MQYFLSFLFQPHSIDFSWSVWAGSSNRTFSSVSANKSVANGLLEYNTFGHFFYNFIHFRAYSHKSINCLGIAWGYAPHVVQWWPWSHWKRLRAKRLIALLDTEQCGIKTQTPALMISPNRLQTGSLITSPLRFNEKFWHNLKYRRVMPSDCWGILTLAQERVDYRLWLL